MQNNNNDIGTALGVVGVIIFFVMLAYGTVSGTFEAQREGEKAQERLDKFSQEMGYNDYSQLERALNE